MSESEKATRKFLTKCSLLVRLRRVFSVFSIILPAMGISVLVLRLFGVNPVWLSNPVLLTLLIPLIVTALFLPLSLKSVSLEVDKKLQTKSLFNAYFSAHTSKSRFFEIICTRCSELAKRTSAFSAVNVLPAKILAFAFLGIIIGFTAFLIPKSSIFSESQILAAIVANYKLESGGGEKGDSKLPPAVQEVLESRINEIVRMLGAGKKEQAVEKIADAVKELKKNSNATSEDAAKRKLLDAGIEEKTAEFFASGHTNTGFDPSAVTKDDIQKAAEALGSGLRGASLAKAVNLIENGASADLALKEAQKIAQQISTDQKLREKLVNLLQEFGKEVFEDLSDEARNKILASIEVDSLLGNEPEVRKPTSDESIMATSQDMLSVVSTTNYPFDYKIALFSYFSPRRPEGASKTPKD